MYLHFTLIIMDLIKKLRYQAGLHLEKINSRGELETFNNQEEPVTKRSYLDFFPSVSFSYSVNEKKHLQLRNGA